MTVTQTDISKCIPTAGWLTTSQHCLIKHGRCGSHFFTSLKKYLIKSTSGEKSLFGFTAKVYNLSWQAEQEHEVATHIGSLVKNLLYPPETVVSFYEFPQVMSGERKNPCSHLSVISSTRFGPSLHSTHEPLGDVLYPDDNRSIFALDLGV